MYGGCESGSIDIVLLIYAPKSTEQATKYSGIKFNKMLLNLLKFIGFVFLEGDWRIKVADGESCG